MNMNVNVKMKMIRPSIIPGTYQFRQSKSYMSELLESDIVYILNENLINTIQDSGFRENLAEKEMGWKATRGLDEMCNYSKTIKLGLDSILLIENFFNQVAIYGTGSRKIQKDLFYEYKVLKK